MLIIFQWFWLKTNDKCTTKLIEPSTQSTFSYCPIFIHSPISVYNSPTQLLFILSNLLWYLHLLNSVLYLSKKNLTVSSDVTMSPAWVLCFAFAFWWIIKWKKIWLFIHQMCVCACVYFYSFCVFNCYLNG